jgi:para-nitrobenzyl esterase
MRRAVLFGVVCVLATCGAPRQQDPIRVDGGLIRGAVGERDPSIRVWRGIPFAAPPVGELRWKPPQPVVPWEGEREATADAPACFQPEMPPGIVYGPVWKDQSEDCLYLNVWSGAASAAERRPVMVWIHGGSLERGTAAHYSGESLAMKGVVLVSIQYRLNAFGFLAHPELTAESEHGSSGNYGLLDQIAALEWVQRNISSFGGDPSNVTIFGESAGSWSVCFQMATPLSAGLFHRGIGQSGTAFFPLKPLADDDPEAESAEEMGQRFAEALGCTTLEEMRAVPAEAIIEALYDTDLERRRMNVTRFELRPALDGWAIREQVLTTFREGRQHPVPVILGYNRDEASITVRFFAPKTVAEWEQGARRELGEFADPAMQIYPVERDEDIRAAFLASGRDRAHTWPMKTWARLMEQAGLPVWMYHFTRVPPGPWAEELGAYHAAEIVYVFDGLGRSDRPYTEVDQRVADAMSSYWVNFATTGDPNGEGLPPWPAWDSGSDRYMEFGDVIEAKTGLYPEAYELWDRIYAAQRAKEGE